MQFCLTSTMWFGIDCLATPGNCWLPESSPAGSCSKCSRPQVAVQAIHWRHLGPPTTCPTMPLPGVITGHYGLGPVSRAGRNKPSGHLHYWGWPLILSGFGHLPEGRVRLPRSCQPIPSRTFSIDLLIKRALTSSFDLRNSI